MFELYINDIRKHKNINHLSKLKRKYCWVTNCLINFQTVLKWLSFIQMLLNQINSHIWCQHIRTYMQSTCATLVEIYKSLFLPKVQKMCKDRKNIQKLTQQDIFHFVICAYFWYIIPSCTIFKIMEVLFMYCINIQKH